MPIRRLTDVLRHLFGLEISEGALVNIPRAGRPAFSEQVRRIRAALLSGTAIASDETGLRVGKANWWLWVFHHDTSAVFVADRIPTCRQ
jgi:transposase